MEINEKLSYLEAEIDARIEDFNHKRNRDKKKAFILKVLSILFSAIITILLGVKVDDFLSGIFKNIALILGSSITVISAIDAFYNHRSLWVQRTITTTQLFALKRDINYYKLGLQPSEIKIEIIDSFFDRFNQILKNELNSWLKLRDETPPKPEKSSQK